MLSFDPPLPSLPSIAGRSAVVTGAAHGIGLGIASALAELGAAVVAVDRDVKALERAFGDRDVIRIAGDLLSDDPVDLAETVLSYTSPVEYIVNNVGIATPKRFLEANRADFDRVLTTNLRSPWFFTQRLVSDLVTSHRGGGIIFLSSLHDTFIRLQPDYSASKAAIAMLVKELAHELASAAIRVNAVAPGAIETLGAQVTDEERQTANKLIPLGRLGQPQDVARIVVALLSDELGGYVTGANVRVDGGLGLHSWAR